MESTIAVKSAGERHTGAVKPAMLDAATCTAAAAMWSGIEDGRRGLEVPRDDERRRSR